MKKCCVFLFVSFFLILLSAEYYSGDSEEAERVLRAPVWVFVEGQPGLMSEEEGNAFIPAREALQDIAQFLLSGLSYGWKFSYTPSDKARAVKEVFEMDMIVGDYKLDKLKIRYKDVSVKYPYVHSWVEYPLHKDEVSGHAMWAALKFKTIKGRGTGERKDELKGVKTAYTNAIKDAIMKYAKKTVKNRPKCLVGEVLLKSSPRLFCASGLFKAEVELFINIREVIPYTAF